MARPDTGMVARGGLTGFALLLLAAALVRAAPDGPDSDDANRRLRDLGARLQRLERTVGIGVTDSSPPSLERRVTVLEDGLRALSRAGGQPGWSSVSENLRELQQLLRDNTQRQEELGRRLASVERTAGAGDLQREVRDLRGRLDDLRRQVEDLRGRVARLETRR